jgi:hypothetical protein
VNERFGTSFTPFAHTTRTVTQCFEIIEDRARRPPWDHTIGAFLAGTATLEKLRYEADRWGAESRRLPVPENRVARPSPQRLQRKRDLHTAFLAPNLAPLRSEAERVYATFVETA